MEKSTSYLVVMYFILASYIIYGIFGIGATGLFFSCAVGLIAVSLDFSLELIIAFLILSGLLWKFVILGKKEGFQVPTGTGDNLQAIVKKIQQVEQTL
jgi:hypothetical protein